MMWPERLQINGWSGPHVGNVSETERSFASGILSSSPGMRAACLFPQPPDLRNWSHPDVGWGLLVPENEALSETDRARCIDAPEPLQRLLAARPNHAVLRYRPNASAGLIRRYFSDGSPAQDLQIGARFGIRPGSLPLYILIYGAPTEIPWSYQYQLQVSHFVGRLDLAGPPLDTYVTALIADWSGGSADFKRSLVWAADDDLGATDITRKMRSAVAAPVAAAFKTDNDLTDGSRFLDGATSDDGSVASLIDVLTSHQPGVVITTSHGKTGPLDDVDAMKADLGLPVDRARQALRPGELLSSWRPRGAIWYSHACCSAGSPGETAFEGLVGRGSDVERMLKAIVACGAITAPLPRSLLGCEEPARAFIGHVEPTFDWSISHPLTGQYMTDCLIEALYSNLYSGQPVGMALAACRRFASQLLTTWEAYSEKFILGEETRSDLLAVKLMHNDWRAFVLLGDPTVKLALPS